MDTNNTFLTRGKITTTPEYWEVAKDTFVTSGGITPGFSKVLGEQLMLPVKGLSRPFYTAFAGTPLKAGTTWEERLRYKTTSFKRKEKATAEDNFKFYDSAGMEKVFSMSVNGWKPITIPSSLDMAELFMDGRVEQINSILVDGAKKDYDEEIETDIQMKAIMTTTKSAEVDITDFSAVRKKIRKTVSEMRGETVRYNELSTEQNAKLNLGADEVYVFIPEILLGDMTSDEAGLPSPEKLVNNGTIIPIPDSLPTPLTTIEYNDIKAEQGWSTDPLPTCDEPKPEIFICSSRRIEYRPYLNEYKINPAFNGAGDFSNYHTLWKGIIGVRTWENGIRINNVSGA